MTSNINKEVWASVQEHLTAIEQTHSVTIIQAVESGSRAWGFPSPDSDYDVRFLYANAKDWYIQLGANRDVIELPINDELDIAGWDLRKALNLANKGNAVVHEWMRSPIVYRQHGCFDAVYDVLESAFNPTAVYHHYRSMAKKALADIQNTEVKKLKRFLYFARATLSACWVTEHGSAPSIVFDDLVSDLLAPDVRQKVRELVERKACEAESAVIEIDKAIVDCFVELYGGLEAGRQLAQTQTACRDNDLVALLHEVEAKL